MGAGSEELRLHPHAGIEPGADLSAGWPIPLIVCSVALFECASQQHGSGVGSHRSASIAIVLTYSTRLAATAAGAVSVNTTATARKATRTVCITERFNRNFFPIAYYP